MHLVKRAVLWKKSHDITLPTPIVNHIEGVAEVRGATFVVQIAVLLVLKDDMQNTTKLLRMQICYNTLPKSASMGPKQI